LNVVDGEDELTVDREVAVVNGQRKSIYLTTSIVERFLEDDGSAVNVVIRFGSTRDDVEVVASVDLVGGDTDAFDVENFSDL
jgi:hypothetical protein